MKSKTFLGHVKVDRKISMISFMFVAVMTIIIITTIIGVQKQRSNARLLDLMGRQRVLNQWHIRDALLQKSGFANDYKLWRETFDDTLDKLINGGQAIQTLRKDVRIEIPPAPTAALKALLLEQQEIMSDVEKNVDEVLNLQESDASYRTKVEKMSEMADRLHFNVNDSVKVFTAHSEAQIARFIKLEVILGIAATLLGLVTSIVIGRGITRPLNQVVNSAKAISTGDLRGEKLNIEQTDEIGQLAEVFDLMTDNLREIARQNLDATANINSATAQILASTQQQAASTKEQAAAVQETTSTVEEIRQAGQQISEKATQVATAAEATASARDVGLKAVKDAVQTMELIREQVETVAENIVALSEKTQAIGEIIQTVSDIAEQSHLLALNAAIEAAAAGESGRSFSVVATEIKNLADQAKESTVQVRGILGDIQKGISSSVMQTEEAVKRVETGKKQSDLAEQSILKFADTTEKSVQTFQQIVGATNQQQIGYEQVTLALKEIRTASEQTATGTSELEAGVSNLNSLSQQLRTTVERYQV